MTKLKARTLLVSVIAVAAAFTVGIVSLSARHPASHNYIVVAATAAAPNSSTPIDTAVVEATVAHQQVYASSVQVLQQVPRMRQASSATQLQTVPGTSMLAQPSAEGMRQLRELKITQINRRFAGAAASKESRAVGAVEEANKDPNFRSLDGGVSSVAVKSSRVSGRHADVRAIAVVWSSMAQKQSDGTWITATPRNILQMSMSLDLTASGEWVVTSFAWSFAPGSEP